MNTHEFRSEVSYKD